MATPNDPTEPTGSAWSSDTPTEAADPTPVATGDAATAATPSSARRRGPIVAGLVALLAIGGIVGVLLATRGGDEPSTIVTDPASSQMDRQGSNMAPPDGMDPRGVDPDGDDWTGGGRRPHHDEFDDHHEFDEHHGDRGVDPDGDDWTGGGGMTPPTTASAGA